MVNNCTPIILKNLLKNIFLKVKKYAFNELLRVIGKQNLFI